ncbi:hypothetical protein AB3S75_028571 [Citrus x aurantiifolia]
MASASGLLTPSVPSLRRRVQPSTWKYRSGFCFSQGTFRRVLCSSTIAGSEKSVSSSESRAPRLINRGCKLVGCGSAVPTLQISNDDLAKIVDTSDEWISVRTGIRNRRVLSGNESLTGLAVEAASRALQMAEVNPEDVDLVLMCTSTPEDLFGAATQIPKALGCKNNPLAYDITAACSGFLLGLVSAACHIRGGGFRNVLVIGGDALSRFTDWTDRGSCILFGDAAGAVLVQACDSEDDGLISFDVHSDGEGGRHLNACIKGNQTNDALGSNVRVVPQTIESALEKAGLTMSSIDWLLLHQANQRIIDAVANRLDVPMERVISNLANYGNTSAASIPLALDEAVRSGKVKPGHTIAAAGFGAGLTWGSAILRWG